MRASLPLAIPFALALAACGGPAGGAEDAGPPDSGPPTGIAWALGPDYPVPVAFGAAMVLPVGDVDYLFVMGGAGGSWGALGSFYAEVRRAEILADHSLGPWEDAGRISTTMRDLPLAGHGAIHIFGDDPSAGHGVAVAGGGTNGGIDLPLVLASYVDVGGALSVWGRFDPMLDNGQGFGTFDRFESHQLALVGGILDGAPTDRVVIAPILGGAMSPIWLDGPPLPTPRFGHASTLWNGEVYLVAGANDLGARRDLLRTTRPTPTSDVDGWQRVGELPAPLVFPVAAAEGGVLYVLGGVAGELATAPATDAVLAAPIDAAGQVGTFEPLEGGALPYPIAAAIAARDGDYLYLVGGVDGPDLTASARVAWGRLP